MAGEGNLGKLIVSIGTDTKELSKGLGEAQNTIEGFQKTANKVLGLIGFSLTASALVDLGRKTIEYGETLNNLSQQTGIAAAEIAKLKYVAEQSDTSIEAVTSSFKFLSRAMNEAASGNSQAIETFNKFHVDFQNADGTLRKYQDVMLDVADRIKNTSNQTVVLAEGQKLLGKNVQQLLPLFREGADGIRRLTSEYEAMQLRIGMTDTQINEFAKNSDTLGDKWKELSTAFQFMLIEVMTPLVPLLEKITQFLIDQDWEQVGKFVLSIADGFKAMGDELVREVNLLIDLNNAMYQLGELLGIGPLARFFGALDGGASMKDALDAAVKSPPPFAKKWGQNDDENVTTLGEVVVRAKAEESGQGIGGFMNKYGTGEGQRAPDDFYKYQANWKDKYGTGQGQQAAPGFYQGGGQDILGINFGDIMAKMEELKTKWSDVSKQVGELWGNTLESITSGFGTSVAEMIVDGKDFGDAMKELWSDIAKAVIAEIVKIIAQQIVLFTWQVITGTVGSGNLMPGGGGGKKFLGIFDKGGVTPQARNGLLYGANGFATTGNMGEAGMHAIVHPNEIISPIDKFFDAIKNSGGQNITIHASGAAANDPQLLAELVATETDRRRRRP